MLNEIENTMKERKSLLICSRMQVVNSPPNKECYHIGKLKKVSLCQHEFFKGVRFTFHCFFFSFSCVRHCHCHRHCKILLSLSLSSTSLIPPLNQNYQRDFFVYELNVQLCRNKNLWAFSKAIRRNCLANVLSICTVSVPPINCSPN